MQSDLLKIVFKRIVKSRNSALFSETFNEGVSHYSTVVLRGIIARRVISLISFQYQVALVLHK